MAIPLQPAQPVLPGYPWNLSDPPGVAAHLDLSRLWISRPPDMTALSPLEGASRMPRDCSGAGPASDLVGRPTALHFPASKGRGHYMEPSQPAGAKRLVLNHNKAITKKLASAVHYQQILDCVAESVQYFDEVNVATALHRLAKLQPPVHSGQGSPIIYADQFQQLIAAIKRLLDRFEAQAVSNTMWAFATLSYFPEDNLLEDLANHAVSIMGTFRPQATSNTLWAFAKLSYCPNKALLHASATQMMRDLPKSVPQDISNTLWAFASLRFYPGAELMAGAARQAVLTMQHFKPQEIANTLWSFATLGHDPEDQLLDAMAIQMIARIQQFRPQAVSNSLWAYARLAYNPGKLLMEVATQKAIGMLHQYTSQELSNTLWALATLEHHPGSQMLEAAAIQIARRIEQFTPQDMSNSLWAFAKLFHFPNQELLLGAAIYMLRHWARFKPSELACTFASLAVLRGCTPQTWQLLLTKLGTVAPASFDEPGLQQLFQTYLLVETALALSGLSIRQSFPQPLLEAAETAWRAGVRPSEELSALHREVSATLWKLGVAHRNGSVTPDGLFCIDIALDSTSVVVDLQETSAFSMNSRAPLGPSIIRRIMLESRGFTVLSVPYYYWALLKAPEQREQYLSSVIATVALTQPQRPPLAATAAIPSDAFSASLPAAVAASAAASSEPPLSVSEAPLRLPSGLGFDL